MKKVIKAWFADKERIYETAFDMSAVKRETEKAVLVTLHCWNSQKMLEDYSDKWLPKSVLISEEEAAAEAAAAKRVVETREQKMAAGLERNRALLAQAKAAGVKGVREGMRTATLIEKLRAAGLQV